MHITQADLRVFVFTLNEVRPPTRVCVWVCVHVSHARCVQDGVTEEHTESEEEVTACQQWVLPAKEFHGLWERCCLSYSLSPVRHIVGVLIPATHIHIHTHTACCTSPA